MKLTKLAIAALQLMSRKGGACPGCDEATKALTFRMADKLVGEGLCEYRQWRGMISYHITDKGRQALEMKTA